MHGKTSATRTAHEKALRSLRCVVSNTDQQIELHHCHGGSMTYAGFTTGLRQKANYFLQIPLTFQYHRGEFDIEHIGVARWEELFGSQLSHLHGVSDLLGYDVVQLGVALDAAR